MKEYKKDGKEINNKTNKKMRRKERIEKNQIRKKERTGEKESGPL